MKLSVLLLRAGLAATFLYAGVAAFLNPVAWIGFFPIWLVDLFPGNIIVYLHSAFNIVLAGWLILGIKYRLAGLVSALFIAGIIFFNLGTLDVTFRDFGLLAIGLALFFWPDDSDVQFIHEQNNKEN